MRAGFSLRYKQVIPLFFLLFLFSVFSGCHRSSQELPVMPPATHPLAREYLGYGVVNISFTHLLDEPGPGGISRGYLRRGTVVRIIARRQVIIRGKPESWVLAEGNYQGSTGTRGAGASSQGWLQESTLDVYDNESRAKTASKAMNL